MGVAVFFPYIEVEAPQPMFHRPSRLSLLVLLCRETSIVWRFINNDIWDTILPSMIIFATGWQEGSRSWGELPLTIFYAASYAVLYIYTFCISNQLAGIEEDRINKPYRPLPQGQVTIKATYWRLLIYNLLYLGVAYLLEIFWYSVAWVAVSLKLNFCGWSDHWATKNLVGMTLGTFILFNVQWRIAQLHQPISDTTLVYFIVYSIWAGFALPLQDMRDQAGDREMGRMTLPIAVGDRRARVLMAMIFFTMLPSLFLCGMLTQLRLSEILNATVPLIILVVQVLLHWGIGFRILVFRGPEADHKTYLCYVFLFCAAIPVIWII